MQIQGSYNLNNSNVGSSVSKPLSSLGREIIAHGGTEIQANKYTSRREAIRAGLVECATCASRKYQDGCFPQCPPGSKGNACNNPGHGIW